MPVFAYSFWPLTYYRMIQSSTDCDGHFVVLDIAFRFDTVAFSINLFLADDKVI